MDVRITIANIGQAIAAFSKDLTQPIRTVIDGMFIPEVVSILRNNAPRRSGRMANSIYGNAMGAMEWGIGVGVNYEQFVRYGTMPHMIYPVEKKALFWQGCEHPSAYARNPGIVPDDYVSQSKEEFNAAAQRTYEAMFGIISQELRF